MKIVSLFLIIFFISHSYSQYILGKGLYFGASAEGGIAYLFKSDIQTDTEKSVAFKGLSYAYGLNLMYAFNFKNYLLLETVLNRSFIPHKINELSKTGIIENEREFIISFNKYRLVYISGIQNSSWIMGGGAEGLFFNAPLSDSDLINVNQSVNGLVFIGLKKNNLGSVAMIYFSYSIPLTYFKKTDDIKINHSLINLHIKYSFQLL